MSPIQGKEDNITAWLLIAQVNYYYEIDSVLLTVTLPDPVIGQGEVKRSCAKLVLIHYGRHDMSAGCQHFNQIHTHAANTSGCEECMKMGDTWVHLRVCLTCGHTGCCDQSKNRHATRHFEATGHPIMRSKERGETWGWGYIDEEMFDPI